MAFGVIYKITNKLNGKIYIGQTTQTLNRRIGQHKRANSVIGQAIRKHGWKNFTVEVLEECDTLEQLNEREKFWIAHFDCKAPKGYNLTDGGDGASSLESREKMSESHTGKKLSAEHRKKIGATFKGVQKSPEHRRKIGAAQCGEKNHFFGKHHTEAARIKISEAGKGKPSSFLGKHHTDESKAKLSVSLRGNTPFKNLSSAITEHKLSYASLANIMRLSKTTFSNKMRGRYNFTAKDIAKLVEIFGLSAEYLMARDD
ncbi:MAG: GIY-YIG nuclease family protein [Selenomonadaceae bacterium]|nr:GIY-YIG nuclease family protein [Selenomonadaceae bacterium]